MDEMISTSEAARRLGVKPQTIRAMVRDSRLRATRVGTRLRIPVSAVDAYFEAHKARSIEHVAVRKQDQVSGLLRALLAEVRGLRQDLTRGHE